MANILTLLLKNPGKATRFWYTFLVQVFLVLLRRLLLPHWPYYQTLRLQLQRAYLSSTNFHFPDLVHRLPIKSCPEIRARRLGTDWTGYLIPGSVLKEATLDHGELRSCVVVYAHGGGYARGEARMYMRYMERWVKEAEKHKLKLRFLSVEYRKDKFTSSVRMGTNASLTSSSDYQRMSPCPIGCILECLPASY